mmetsp:Transcript_10833/g.27856  ORF Transcript_10833/g.27856 Transcript_10833/m.27856 type:complete len:937 (-) Transcript_10833:157-2967(-)
MPQRRGSALLPWLLAAALLQLADAGTMKVSIDVGLASAGLRPLLDLETCSPRDRDPGSTKGSELGLTKNIGVVLVVCNETLSFLKDAGCPRKNDLQYHIYSVCGVRQEDLPGLEHITDCMAEFNDVVRLVYADLTQTQGHAEFLTHIIQNYELLDENLIFATAEMLEHAESSQQLSLAESIAMARTGEWGYRPMRNHKNPINFESPPVTGDSKRYQMELCTIYKRFTCESECKTCSEGASCAYAAQSDAFVTSASRIRTLALRDYSWLREWLQQWQEDEQGALHGEIADRMWPMILGCPEDIHASTPAGGCRHNQHFPENGVRLKPPDALIDVGLAHFPPPTFKHDNRHPYPLITSPIYKYSRSIMFVITLGKSLPKNVPFGALLEPIFGNILYHHPSASVTLLVHSDVMTKLRLSRNFFAGRLRVMQVDSPIAYNMFGVLPSDLDPETEVPEWQTINGMRNHNFEMRRKYLRMMAEGQILDEFGEEQRNHLVFMNINSALLGNVWEVFEGQAFDIALPFQPLPRRPFDSTIMFVHLDRLSFAANLMDDVLYNHLLAKPTRSFDEIIHNEYLSCLPDRWLLDATIRMMSCGDAPEGTVRDSGRVHVKLLPAAKWNGVIVKGTNLPLGKSFRHEWAAAAAHPDARVVRFLVHEAPLLNIHQALFKATVTDFDPASRHAAAHRFEDPKYSWGKGAREKLIQDAMQHVPALRRTPPRAEYLPRRHPLSFEDRMGPLDSSPRRRPVRHPRTEFISDQQLAEVLGIPSKLLTVNPEEINIDWDDPFMGYFYEIRNPKKPVASDFVLPKASNAQPEPRFPRSWHNRAFISKVSALYDRNYIDLLRRPSKAREVVAYWGGDVARYPDARVASHAADERLAVRKRKDASAEMSDLDQSLVPMYEDGLHVEYLPAEAQAEDIFGRIWSVVTSVFAPPTLFGRIVT